MYRLPPPLHPLNAVLVALAVAAPASHAAKAVTGHLNDTGITSCESPNGSMNADCRGSAQDAGSGRDVTNGSNADGRVGFRFLKLATDGSALPADATQWACVADEVTGLVWEMKTVDGGLHDAARRYTNLGDGSAADASTFVAAVGRQALCGRTDWRLPARGELQGLVDYGKSYPGPTIDSDWFPNSDGYSFWTSTVQASDPQGASWYVNFMDGYTATLVDSYAFGEVRVVSGTLTEGSPRFTLSANGKEVADSRTGLVWARCSLGQDWDGAACAGGAAKHTWQESLRIAAAIADRTGKGWRIPNAKEIASIAVDGQADPALDTTLFPGTPSKLYWSSSPYMGFPFYAWTFFGYDGSVVSENVTEAHLVRLVR